MNKDSILPATRDHKPANPPALGGHTLAGLKTSGIIEIGYTNLPPYSYQAANAWLTGDSMEIGEAVVVAALSETFRGFHSSEENMAIETSSRIASTTLLGLP